MWDDTAKELELDFEHFVVPMIQGLYCESATDHSDPCTGPGSALRRNDPNTTLPPRRSARTKPLLLHRRPHEQRF